ncbi:MAG: DUF2271 domain-containing protein [Crocinitomicaceae bacterium]|nr:DUF2271 domain-containing protein [Crocinitomicaceae bacterium]
MNKFKCLIQMTNYPGEGAYLVVSVVNEKNEYLETIKVFGTESKWYADLKNWFPFYEKNKAVIDGRTGATLSGGERSIFTFSVNAAYFNGKNKLRFESSVEDQKYHINDLLLPLNKKSLVGKHEGTGYVRYIQVGAY